MTKKTRSFRPSPSVVISCLALFLALTGSAFAVGIAKNSVRSAQIVDGTVRTVDVRDNAVNAQKIAPDAVTSEEIAENAVSSPEVAPDSLTTSDLGTASVGSDEVVDHSLTGAGRPQSAAPRARRLSRLPSLASLIAGLKQRGGSS